MSPSILFLTSEVKGLAALRQARALGCTVYLLTKEKYRHADWPWEAINEPFFMPDLNNMEHVRHAVAYLARGRQIDLVIPLDDFEVETAAMVREHMRLPGMNASTARNFRDKLAMRTTAKLGGVRVPEFVGVFNYDRLREFMARVPAPWMLKPRGEASAMGIKKIHHSEELWRTLDTLGDQQSYFVLEQFVAGDVFHVDGLVHNGQLLFAAPHQYGRPPFEIYHGGGVYHTRTMDWNAPITRDLLDFNATLLHVLGMTRGATHAEYIRAQADGQLYFLECAARVGGANTAEMVEFATGINLWAEWVKMDVAEWRNEPYILPTPRQGYAAVMNCLAKQDWPNLEVYNDPEVVWRLKKEHHAGIILTTPEADRMTHLLGEYTRRFQEDFLMVLPPRDKAPD